MAKVKLYKNYWDIVILPPPQVRDWAISLSRKLARKFGGEFILGRKGFVPHISLYHVPISKKNLPEVRKVLREIISRTKFGELSVTSGKVPDRNTVWLEVSNPRWLKQLHITIAKATHKLRDKRFRVERTWGKEYSKRQLRNIKLYGSPYIGSAFRPHISLTSLKRGMTPEEIRDFISSASRKTKKFKVHSISLCQLGAHHACHKIVFTLRKDRYRK